MIGAYFTGSGFLTGTGAGAGASIFFTLLSFFSINYYYLVADDNAYPMTALDGFGLKCKGPTDAKL